MLSKEYCELLLDELTHFETWCQQNQTDVFRPNTMNNVRFFLFVKSKNKIRITLFFIVWRYT